MSTRFRKNKRPYKKRRRPRLRIASQPVPDRQFVKLKYRDEFSLNAGIATAAHHYFCANGLYDPDVTGTGHQPMGFDEWMTFYDHYTVIGAKCTVQFYNTGSTANDQCIVGIYLNDDQVSPTDVTTIMEQEKCHYRPLGLLGSSADTAKVSFNFSARKEFGRNTGLIGSKDYTGSTIANPAETMYFDVFAASAAPASDPASINCVVNLEYIAVLTERRTLAQS